MYAGMLMATALAVIIIVNGRRTDVKRLRRLDYAVGGTLMALVAVIFLSLHL